MNLEGVLFSRDCKEKMGSQAGGETRGRLEL